MIIDYAAQGFSDPALNRRDSMSLHWHDLVWATMMVGKSPHEPLFPYGSHSALDALARIATLRSTLQVDLAGYLRKTNHYQALEKTEKGFVSYSHGMMFTKLFASHHLNIHWLTHLTSIQNMPIQYYSGSRTRPDLIGWTWNNGDEYSVFEAKGRSGTLDTDAVSKAKEQAQSIRSINGNPPSYSVATESFYYRNMLQGIAEDPTPSDDAIDVKFEVKEYMKAYYAGALFLSREGASMAKQLGLEVRINDRVDKILNKGNSDKLSELSRYDDSPNQDRNGWVLFPDGVEIQLEDDIWN